MRVKKILFPKTDNGNSLKISTNIEKVIIKMQGEIKNKCKLINTHVKIINSTKK